MTKPRRFASQRISTLSDVLEGLDNSSVDIVDQHKILNYLTSANSTSKLFTERTEWPSANPSLLHFQVPKTSLWVSKTEIRNKRKTILITAFFGAIFFDLPTIAISTIGSLLESTTILSSDEIEALAVIAGNADGDPFKTPIPLSRVKASYHEATIDIDAILNSLEDKKVLTRTAESIKLIE